MPSSSLVQMITVLSALPEAKRWPGGEAGGGGEKGEDGEGGGEHTVYIVGYS